MSSEESTLGKLVREADLNRRALVSKIQDHLTTATGRPYRALSYMSRFDVPAGNILPQDAVMFREAINQLGNPENLALVIHSPGGVIEATEKIGLLLREHVKQLLIIIPDAAKSAATMLALMGNEICMSDLSELGPIDPQINLGLDPNGVQIFRPAWAIKNAPFHLQEMLKEGLNPNIVALLTRSLDPTLLDVAENALDLAATIAETWLAQFMGLSKDDSKRIAEYLSNASNFMSHGRPVRFPDAQKLGLKVKKMDPTLDTLSFELYLRTVRQLRERRVKLVDWAQGSLAADM